MANIKGFFRTREPFSFLVLCFCNRIVFGSLITIILFGHLGFAQRHDHASNEIILRFGGDVLLGARYEEGVGHDIHRGFKDFDLFRTDDLSMVNLENPVTTRGARRVKPWTFRMHPRFLDVITTAGIDVVNIANNHIFDFGKVGLFDTFTALDSVNLPFVGAGRNGAEAHRPYIKEIKGREIAILGYYGGHESPAATKKSGGVAARRLDLISRDIRLLKEKESDCYVVVNFHWGIEKARKPQAQQRSFAHAVIDAGADAIIGHHPHVLQGVELYKNKVIVYSLGNLIFGGNSRHTYNTGIVEIRLRQKNTEYKFIPVRVEQWRATEMQGPAAQKVLNDVRKLSRIFPKSIFN